METELYDQINNLEGMLTFNFCEVDFWQDVHDSDTCNLYKDTGMYG